MGQKNYWFKAKRYGWGWYPASWQGWLVIAVYTLYIIYRAEVMAGLFDTWTSASFRFVFELILPTVVLLAICLWKGEKLRWRWGGERT